MNSRGWTPLCAAAWKDTHSLVMWLLDEKGTGVYDTLANGRGFSPFHLAKTPDILKALLNAFLTRGTDALPPDLLAWHVKRTAMRS